MNLSVIFLQIFLFFFAMFEFQETSTIKRLPYLHGIDEHRIEVHLEDYVSPEFVEYYFYRFGYDIEKIDIQPVQGIITGSVSERNLERMSAHPFVQNVTVMNNNFISPFLFPAVLSDEDRADLFGFKKITFDYYVTDEMVEAFLFQNQKLGIELLPRAPKSVVLKPTKLPTRLMAELDLLIYVKETKEVVE